ncbi:hypothetical protein BKG95_08525 [Rodentibacter pneumotropicus]|uniref:AAA family ATPase n=1 Tax=Rodentibacter pneumotropicus TaxID=758 RepID=UPI0009D4205C|nr:AAA family ATPase [Rodentibacter pneumotropicus]OOF67085.1 hypothetical protein BKG95_08525 [Rodentibacter pneumotropicus]
MDNNILLEINDFRAISNASISINGITVVSGINGSGKSTISKLFYYIFSLSNDFSKIVLKNNIPLLEEYKEILEKMIESLPRNSFDKRRSLRFDFNRRFYIPRNYIKYDRYQIINNLNNGIELIEKHYKENKIDSSVDYRIQLLLNELVKRKYHREIFENHTEDFPGAIDSSKIFDYIKNEVKNIIHKLYEENESKPKKYLDVELMKVFHSELSGSIKMFEYGNPIYSNESKNISKPLLTNNAVYIDTPMAFYSSNENHPYWDDLNGLLKSYDVIEDNNSKQITSIISDEILLANVELERDLFGDDKILYKRKIDDLELELSDCATGIKSLSLILLLIKNGTINSQTLLILDEPESHLHPQWIVEYARILVLLREKIGCRIFISSHSPDMVQAIKQFSEKYNMKNQTLFYLANQNNETRKFRYLNLNNNISEIFKCFNKSLDKIDEYYEDQIFTR